MGSYTFYPDANPETSSVDGRTNSFQDNVVWMPSVPSGANSGEVTSNVAGFSASDSTDRWDSVSRGIFLFDTSSLDDSANIISATIDLDITAKSDTLPDSDFEFNIYSSNPNSNITLQASDWTTIGNTEFATAITYPNIAIGSNEFELNASGIAAISLTGISKFGIAEGKYDKGASTPSWSSNGAVSITASMAESGTSKPALTVITSEFDKFKVNIGDVWKDVASMKINIGDVWKEVIGVWINIGDTWKLVV